MVPNGVTKCHNNCARNKKIGFKNRWSKLNMMMVFSWGQRSSEVKCGKLMCYGNQTMVRRIPVCESYTMIIALHWALSVIKASKFRIRCAMANQTWSEESSDWLKSYDDRWTTWKPKMLSVRSNLRKLSAKGWPILSQKAPWKRIVYTVAMETMSRPIRWISHRNSEFTTKFWKSACTLVP